MKNLSKFYDPSYSGTFAANLRKKRFALLNSLIESIPGSPFLKILDIGGTESFWRQRVDFLEQQTKDLDIILLNTYPEVENVKAFNLKGMVGDARNMHQFKDKEFDIVISNSVIEHVGSYQDQTRMANEVMRVGKRYFVQTPNLYFPIEPHVVLPFFQFLPIELRVWIVTHFDTLRRKKWTDKQKALEYISEIRLLTKKEMVELFPHGTLVDEEFLGLVKSFVVYGGWETTPSALKQ